MTRKNKTIIITSAAILTTVTTYLIIRAIKVSRYRKILNTTLSKTPTGTTKDITEGSQNWNSVTYWAKVKPDLQNKSATYKGIASTLYSKVHNIFTSAADVLDTIKKSIKTQAESSYVAYWYIKESNSKQTFLQGINSINQDIAKQIVTYLNSLK